MGWFSRRAPQMTTAEQSLPGRSQEMPAPDAHAVHGQPLKGDFVGLKRVVVGMGCFWGAERIFWTLPGVVTTAVGYAGGFTPNPTYEEVCSGRTGHTEVVLVVFDPTVIGLSDVLKAFWEGHDPTEGMRQGNDVGTQYRSAVFTTNEADRRLAEGSRDAFQTALTTAGKGLLANFLDLVRDHLGSRPKPGAS